MSVPLPSLTLAVGYDKTRPRRLVQHFVDACRGHFADAGAERCIVEEHNCWEADLGTLAANSGYEPVL